MFVLQQGLFIKINETNEVELHNFFLSKCVMIKKVNQFDY